MLWAQLRGGELWHGEVAWVEMLEQALGFAAGPEWWEHAPGLKACRAGRPFFFHLYVICC